MSCVLQECFAVQQEEITQVVYVKVDGIVFVERGQVDLYIMVTVLLMVHLVSVLIQPLGENVNQGSSVLLAHLNQHLVKQVRCLIILVLFWDRYLVYNAIVSCEVDV